MENLIENKIIELENVINEQHDHLKYFFDELQLFREDIDKDMEQIDKDLEVINNLEVELKEKHAIYQKTIENYERTLNLLRVKEALIYQLMEKREALFNEAEELMNNNESFS